MEKLNQIGDEAADETQEFYQHHLELDVQGSGKYQAHLYLGLLAWRSGREAAMDDVKKHLHLAAKTAVALFNERTEVEAPELRRPFEFMIPLFVILIYGDRGDRKKLSRISRTQWATPGQDEFQSFIELLDLLRKHALEFDLNRSSVKDVIDANDAYMTHPYYRPWIDAMCDGLLSVLEGRIDDIEAACNQLLELHEEEAWEGDWKLRLEGVMALWPMALVLIARKHGIRLNVNSPYLPSN